MKEVVTWGIFIIPLDIPDIVRYNDRVINERITMTIQVKYIASEYPLGTTDGEQYTIVPRY
jgi:hypothetical protein